MSKRARQNSRTKGKHIEFDDEGAHHPAPVLASPSIAALWSALTEELSEVEERIESPPAKKYNKDDSQELSRNGKNNSKKKKKRAKTTGQAESPHAPEAPLIDPSIARYWKQRYNLFSLFDEGIQLDYESWYSVSPEVIAEHTAWRMSESLGPHCTVVDAMCGCGGNSIQFARYFDKVIAVDINPERIEMARHNADIYGVMEKIEFIAGDFLQMHDIMADAVFLSPPWGGPEYINTPKFDLAGMTPDGFELFRHAQSISPNIAYFLPRTVDTDQLLLLAGPGGVVEAEKNVLGDYVKSVTAYFGDLVYEEGEDEDDIMVDDDECPAEVQETGEIGQSP